MTLTATCHCGATRIEIDTAPTEANECNCSFCARTGAVWAYYKPGDLRFIARDDERSYAQNEAGMNQHHFCSRCGLHTWGESPDWASMFNNDGTPRNGDTTGIPTERIQALNLRLIDDLDWSGIHVERVDGRNNW